MNGKFPGVDIDAIHDRIPSRKHTMEGEHAEVVLRYRKRPSTPLIMAQREYQRNWYMAHRDEVNAKRRAKRKATKSDMSVR